MSHSRRLAYPLGSKRSSRSKSVRGKDSRPEERAFFSSLGDMMLTGRDKTSYNRCGHGASPCIMPRVTRGLPARAREEALPTLRRPPPAFPRIRQMRAHCGPRPFGVLPVDRIDDALVFAVHPAQIGLALR